MAGVREAKRKAADRAARSREGRRKAGVPEPRVVDQAISEALAFCLDVARLDPRRRRDMDVPIRPHHLIAVAYRILVSRLADGEFAYDPKAVARAIADRLSPRPEHQVGGSSPLAPPPGPVSASHARLQ